MPDISSPGRAPRNTNGLAFPLTSFSSRKKEAMSCLLAEKMDSDESTPNVTPRQDLPGTPHPFANCRKKKELARTDSSLSVKNLEVNGFDGI